MDQLPKMYLDTATSEGMSGSPVVISTTAPFVSIDGQTKMATGGAPARKFLGVYASRIHHLQMQAQLGIMWRRAVIDEIISGGVKGNYELRGAE